MSNTDPNWLLDMATKEQQKSLDHMEDFWKLRADNEAFLKAYEFDAAKALMSSQYDTFFQYAANATRNERDQLRLAVSARKRSLRFQKLIDKALRHHTKKTIRERERQAHTLSADLEV